MKIVIKKYEIANIANGYTQDVDVIGGFKLHSSSTVISGIHLIVTLVYLRG